MGPSRKRSPLGIVLVLFALVGGGVCVVGASAAIAIPAFVTRTRRAQTVEASSHLSELYIASAAYYTAERGGTEPSSTLTSSCTVGPVQTANRPSSTPRRVAWTAPEWRALDFAPPDPVRYAYEIAAEPGRCGHGPSETTYSFRAHGDLDDDGTQSLFEIAAGTDENGEPIRSPGIFIELELE